jgi:hypothetical protein
MKRTTTKEPKATKSAHFHVPEPQRERIVKKFISGQCIREISREEHRSRGTVSRIVNSTEVQSYVKDLRAAYYGLGQEALDALRRALRKSTDGKIAYQLLADIGVVPSQEQRQQTATAYQAENDEEAQVAVLMGRLFQVAVHRSLVYGTPLGQMEQDLEMAGGRINRKTGAIEAIGVGAPLPTRAKGGLGK